MSSLLLRDEFVDDDGYEVTVELPARYEVCWRCNGTGRHDHPAFENGITADEWYGPDWDDESREAYMSGMYDVRCTECKGKRVVLVPDEDRCDPEVLRAYQERQNERARWAAEDRHIRRQESGGW